MFKIIQKLVETLIKKVSTPTNFFLLMLSMCLQVFVMFFRILNQSAKFASSSRTFDYKIGGKIICKVIK